MCCSPRRYIITTTNISGLENQALLEAYDNQIRRKLFAGDKTLPHESLKELLKEIREPVFVFVGDRAINKEILTELRDRYPGIVFVLLPGESFPDWNELGLKCLELVRPELEPGEELQGLDFIYSIDRIHKV